MKLYCKLCSTEVSEDYKGFPLGFLWCNKCNRPITGNYDSYLICEEEMKRINITLLEIKKQFKKARIKIKFGIAYNLYDCGCIVDNSKDKQKVKQNPITHQRVRCCAKCKSEYGKGFLLVKYKKCKCGADHISLNAHASDRCKFCPPLPQVGKFAKAKAKREVVCHFPFLKINNKAFRDKSRWDCLFRNNCADYYIKRKTKAIPCLGCELYQKNPNLL